jgi:mono/diheme cytochrome c family protein
LEALPVIPRLSGTRLVGPLVVLAALGLGLVILSGCDSQGYSDEMIYPVRDDVIVDPTVKPTAEPTQFERPGQWAYLLPEFKDKGGKMFDPSRLTPAQRNAFRKMLNDYFGTPAKPTVKGVPDDVKKDLQLDDATLANGSQLYRRHCLHCHGLTGDGHGPTAPWVNPHPRDYRPGKFKFTSTTGGNARKPTRADLIHTLKQGVEGTSMPSFGLLPPEELNALASYVIHLSARGQLEFEQMRVVLSDPDSPKKGAETVTEGVGGDDGVLVGLLKDWQEADAKLIKVGDFPFKEPDMEASITRGYRLFLGQGVGAASCISCHTDYGRQNTFKYDEWGNIARPRDLTQGVYRGGRRPVDLYYRVIGGLNGTPMPAFVPEGQQNDPQKIKDVWDVVNFVQALPYPSMLPTEIREQIYGRREASAAHAAAIRE